MSRISLATSVWLTTLTAVIVSCLAFGTSLSTAVTVLVLGVTPLALMLWLAASAAPPTVAEILHSVNAPDGR
jgi:hypothetical protein